MMAFLLVDVTVRDNAYDLARRAVLGARRGINWHAEDGGDG